MIYIEAKHRGSISQKGNSIPGGIFPKLLKFTFEIYLKLVSKMITYRINITL